MLGHTLLTFAVASLAAQLAIASPLPAGDTKWWKDLLHKHNGKNLHHSKQGQSGMFLHITDIHIDPTYLENSDPAQLCHRMNTNSSLNTAGHFGTLGSKCDSPVPLVDETFEFLNGLSDIVDFILYTGDTARHDRDNEQPRTLEDVLEDHTAVVKYFTKNFNVDKTKFIPTIGNNDMFVHDIESPNDPIFLNLTELWKPFGLNLDSTFQQAGYFTQDLSSKLKVISANTMYFYNKNANVTDCNVVGSPGAKELIWLQTQFQAARDGGYHVYVIGHIAPTDETGKLAFYPNCFNQYVNLLGSYSDVIYAHLNGHTNADSVAVIVQNSTSNSNFSLVALTSANFPTNLNLQQNPIVTILNNAPSVIPANNPAVRIYRYDTSKKTFGKFLDYIQFYNDLTKSNAKGKAKYQPEYVYSKVYGQWGMGPKEYTNIVESFEQSNSSMHALYDAFEYVQPPANSSKLY